MSAFIFSHERLRELHRQPENQAAATLALTSQTVTPGQLRVFYREVAVYDDETGEERGAKCVAVQDVNDEGKLCDAVLTVLKVELVDVWEDVNTPWFPARKAPRRLDLQDARACGFRTVLGLVSAWRLEHPRSPLARLVWFVFKDQRDRSRWLQREIWRGGDYTSDPSRAVDTLPSLSAEELRELAQTARQTDLGREAARERAMAAESLAERVARLETASEAIRCEIKQELRIITDRKNRGLRKLE
jgi:hypothetical protein